MDELRKKVIAVRRRLAMARALAWGVWGLLAALVVVDLLVLALKFFPGAFEMPRIAAGAALVLVAGAVVAAVWRRQTLFDTALHADVHLNLRERLSSAIALADRHPQPNAPALLALEDDAIHYARAIQPRRDFPLRMPGHARYLALPLVALAALWFMPEMDLFSKPTPPAVTPPSVNQLTEAERKEQADRLKELAQKVREKEIEVNPTGTDLDMAERLERLSKEFEFGTRDEKELVAEMSRLQDEVKLEQRELQKKEQPFRQLRGLQQANQTRDLQRSLKDGNYQQAAQQMQQMAQQMQNSTAEEKEQLAEELKQMAEQVKENQAMSEALEQAAQAVEQAAEEQKQCESGAQQQGGQQEQAGGQNQANNEQASAGSGQQQQQQQQTGANQQGGAQQSQQSPGDSQQQQPGMQGAQAAMQQAASQMGEMQQLAQQMQTLSELQNSLQGSQSQMMTGQNSPQGQQGQQQGNTPGGQPGQSGQQGGGQMAQGESEGQGESGGQDPTMGEWSEGTSEASSLGSGGPGRGQGAVPQDDGSMPLGFVDVFIPGEQNEGEVIAVFEVDAMVPRGESTAGYRNVPVEVRQNAADTISDRDIPVGYRNAVKGYFESINFNTGK